MGYRLYLASMPKAEYNKIKHKCQKYIADLYGEDGCFSVYDLPGHNVVFELGKYVDYSNIMCKQMFIFKDGDRGNYIVNEDFFLHLIETMRDDIYQWDKELRDGKKDVQAELINKTRKWKSEYFKPYSLNKENDTIVTSWLYEYSIFELVKEYKKFDFENNVLIYHGW